MYIYYLIPAVFVSFEISILLSCLFSEHLAVHWCSISDAWFKVPATLNACHPLLFHVVPWPWGSTETTPRASLYPEASSRLHIQPCSVPDSSPACLPAWCLAPVFLPNGHAVRLCRLLHPGHGVWDLLSISTGHRAGIQEDPVRRSSAWGEQLRHSRRLL